jgi:acyl carrier protein
MKDDIKNLIIEVINEHNEHSDEKHKIDLNSEVVFAGNGSVLDSLDFITLMINIENKIFEVYDKNILIVSEKAFSMKYNPFGNLDKLASFIVEILEDDSV